MFLLSCGFCSPVLFPLLWFLLSFGDRSIFDYVSANGQSSNALSYSIKSSYDSAAKLYTTYIEIAISYSALGVSPQDEFVNIMFAARPGNEEGAGMCLGANSAWWCGDYNPSSDIVPFRITKYGIIAN